MDDAIYFPLMYGLGFLLILALFARLTFLWWRDLPISQDAPSPEPPQASLMMLIFWYGLSLSLLTWTFAYLPWEMFVDAFDASNDGLPDPEDSWRHILLWKLYPIGTLIAWWAWWKIRQRMKTCEWSEAQRQSAGMAVALTCWFWALLATLPLFLRLPAATFVFIPWLNHSM